MVKVEALETLGEVVRASNLLSHDANAVVLVSGGADSACAAAAVTTFLGPQNVQALHVNYGLRPTSDRDEQVCRKLCARLRIDLHIERPRLAEGNLQAVARDVRYRAAERLRARIGADAVIVGHTRTDLAETIIYRLAVSPGTRALMGMAAEAGRVVRPLLVLGRSDTRRLATSGDLPFADDETNADPEYSARNRIRADVLPVMAELNPAAERNMAETRAELAEEAGLLETLVLEKLALAGSDAGAVSISADVLVQWPPGLARLALRTLAERAAGRALPLGRGRAAAIVRIAGESRGGEIEIGNGISAICEAGQVYFVTSDAMQAAPVPQVQVLDLPGKVRLGSWEVRAALHAGPVEPAGPGLATLDAAAMRGNIEVRTWREGDRMRPLGMTGSKSLQDLFTDCKVPRSSRHELPVVTVNGVLAWVPGVAVSEDFRLAPESPEVAVLTLHAVSN